MFTRKEWEADKKKEKDLKSPPKKQDVGPNLDKWHKAKTNKEKLALLKNIQKGLEAYIDANDKKGTAIKMLKSRLIDCDLAEDELDAVKRVEKQLKDLKFDELWARKDLRESFIEFSSKVEKSPEGPEFLIALEKKVAPEKIYETYIKPGAKLEVNLEIGIVRILEKLAEQGDYKSMDFKDAKSATEHLMKVELFERWKKDKDYGMVALAKRLGVTLE